MKKALMSYSKKAKEQPDFFIRCQSDLEDAVPELVAEIKEKFLVPRTAKTDTEPFRERFGFRLPDDIVDYINLFWHMSIYGAYDCFKQIENGDGYYKFDEGLVLFPVLAKDSNFDTMHPLDSQGVHFCLPKAIVFLLKLHITKKAKASNARSNKYIGNRVFENITFIIEGSSLPVFHICLLYGFKSNAYSSL